MLTYARQRSRLIIDVHPPRPVIRAARILAIAIIVGMGIGYLYWAASAWHMADAGAYWNAAMRLRDGQELFPTLASVEASDVYRYSPWFAWAAIPFTYLPIQVAGAIWSAILIAASTLAVIPLIRRGAWLSVVFFWPMLIGISAIGNVQALIIAVLVLGIERRSGPFWIALAASLKAFPLLYVLVYIGRREWVKAGLTFALTGLFVAPFLLYQLERYPISVGGAGMLITWPVIYMAVVATSVAAALWVTRTKYGWLAAAVTVCLALPRFFVYDVTYLLVGTAPLRKSRERD
jgi:hypothetical protein